MTDTMIEKVDASLLAHLRTHPQTEVAAIVRCERLSPVHIQQVEAAGLKVARQLRLIRGLAVVGPADALLQLAAEVWVVRIELDQPVHTLK